MKMIKRMMETKAGRVLKRLFGEETGAVLMEYVILAVMIAAACVVAVIYFGRTATEQMDNSTKAMAGDTTGASTGGSTTRTAAAGRASEAESHNAQFHDKGGQGN